MASRKPTDYCTDPDSSDFNELVHGSHEEFVRRMKDPNVHISERLTRFLRFGGILQAISEETGIPREKLVVGGASQYQDRNSSLGPTIHASHIIRVGAIHGTLKTKSPALNKALENFVGHTHNVVRDVNLWFGVGGDIDRFQSGKLADMAKIDFKAPIDAATARTLANFLNEFVEIISKYVDKGDGDKQHRRNVVNEQKIDVCNEGTAENLYETGRAGYEMVKSGEFKKIFYDRTQPGGK